MHLHRNPIHMILRKIFLFTVLTISFTAFACTQSNTFKSLSEAVQAAKIGKKQLIIFRINNNKINFSHLRNEQSTGIVDSLIQSAAFRNPFKKDYLFYYIDEQQLGIEDNLYLSQHFLNDPAPHMIILNDREETIAYIPLLSDKLGTDFYFFIQNRIRDFEPYVKTIQVLEPKLKAKKLSSTELTELIDSRYRLRKASIIHWNTFAASKEIIPLNNELTLFTEEAFNTEDIFFRYLVDADSSYSNLKIKLLQNLKDKAIREANVDKYLSLKSSCDSLRNLSLYGSSKPPINSKPVSTEEKEYQDEETMKLIRLYTNAKNESQLIKAATMFARNLVSSTPKAERSDEKPVIIAGPDNNDIFGKLTVTNEEGDTVKVKSSEDIKSKETSKVSAAALHAGYLSQIAWSFAEVVKNKTNLLEAIVWCKKSIEWYPGKENHHAIAQLYYLTGKPQKAIEHQKKAISIAVSENLTQKQIQYHREALSKFESE